MVEEIGGQPQARLSQSSKASSLAHIFLKPHLGTHHASKSTPPALHCDHRSDPNRRSRSGPFLCSSAQRTTCGSSIYPTVSGEAPEPCVVGDDIFSLVRCSAAGAANPARVAIGSRTLSAVLP